MDTPNGTVFALAAALDEGGTTAWSAWLGDLLFSRGFTLASVGQAHAQTIHRVTVHAGPREAPVLVENRDGHAWMRRRTVTGRPVECIRTVLHRERAATTILDTHWYPTGPCNGVPLESPGATVPRIMLTREGALDPSLPGRIARLLTETAPETAAPHSGRRFLALAGQLARIVPQAGSNDETRAARSAAMQAYLEGKLLALDAPAHESLRILLGEDTAQFVAARNHGKTVAVRSLTLSAGAVPTPRRR